MTWQDQQPPRGYPGRPGSPEELLSDIFKKFKEKFGGGHVPPGAGDQGSSGQSGPFGSKPRRGGLLLLVVGVIILFQLSPPPSTPSNPANRAWCSVSAGSARPRRLGSTSKCRSSIR